MSNGEQTLRDLPLLDKLRARIRRDGPLTVHDYIAACVSDPDHGYWHRPASIGASGDFITAPEISQAFGELIGLWSAVAWQGMGAPSPVRLIELGPGRGTLMRDALRAARSVPAFARALDVRLVEISGTLREMQRATLASAHATAISWHAELREVPHGPAIVIANEFLDALPIDQLVMADGTWRTRVVDLDATGALQFALGPTRSGTDVTPPNARDGDIHEHRPGEARLLEQLAQRPETVALIIDYGPAEPAFGDTLQAVRRHQYVDPLATPGVADLTAHVQFANLAQRARDAGLVADGPITQAEFLGRLGIAERGARLMAANPDRAADIEAAVHRLVSPTGMGQLFKVMAIRSLALPPVPPFG